MASRSLFGTHLQLSRAERLTSLCSPSQVLKILPRELEWQAVHHHLRARLQA